MVTQKMDREREGERDRQREVYADKVNYVVMKIKKTV